MIHRKVNMPPPLRPVFSSKMCILKDKGGWAMHLELSYIAIIPIWLNDTAYMQECILFGEGGKYDPKLAS